MVPWRATRTVTFAFLRVASRVRQLQPVGKVGGFASARMLAPTQAHRQPERGDGEGEGRGVRAAESGGGHAAGVGTEGVVGWTRMSAVKCHVFVLRMRIVPTELVRGRVCLTLQLSH